MTGIINLLRRVAKRIVPSRFIPSQYLQNAILDAAKGHVLSGPFRNMRYVDRTYCSVLHPKLLGVYEKELHEVVETSCNLEIDRVVDIGAAEGYYAVGFACRRPSVPVIAFEMNPVAAATCVELARLNGQANNVRVLGKCDTDALSKVTSTGTSLIICDCEGAEDELLSLEIVTGLKNCHILVETHEFASPGVTQRLSDRFDQTHLVSVIWQNPRTRHDLVIADWYIRQLPDADLERVLDECRPERMRWLWMAPRSITLNEAL